jgi:peptidoglycan/xylan/chitin deacetylase (PgdA/CDA1 family)
MNLHNLQIRLGGIRVLLYHGLAAPGDGSVPGGGGKYWIAASRFREQLARIAKGNHRIRQLRDVWDGPGAADGQLPAVITFDDGWASDFTVALPLLLQAGARAEFFLNTATVGTEGFLSWPQIAEMHRQGMSFQSHGHDHAHLLRLSTPMVKQQLRDSKRIIEDRLGAGVDFLSAPFGLLSRRIVDIALGEGYRAVCTSWAWPARPGKPVIPRIPIDRNTTVLHLSRVLMGSPGWYLRQLCWSGLKYGPRRLLRWPRTGNTSHAEAQRRREARGSHSRSSESG